MTADKPDKPEELTSAQDEIKRLLVQDMQRRLTGELTGDHLYDLVVALLRVPMPENADVAAWEPDTAGDKHFSEKSGQLVRDGEPEDPDDLLEFDEPEMLREPLAPLPQRGISNERIMAQMMETCRREHPELADRLAQFLGDALE